MRIPAWVLLLPVGCCAAAGQDSGTASELRKAARSPGAIVQFVQSHEKFRWEPLWEALHLGNDVFAQPCESRSDCGAELIPVAGSASGQVVLRLNWNGGFGAVFLRFDRQGRGPWRCLGSYEPSVKYFRPEHQVISLGGKSFLTVSAQGWSGSGLAVKTISGFDLSRPGFAPAFTYVAEGHVEEMCDLVSRDVQGHIVSLDPGASEVLHVRYGVHYWTNPCADEPKIEIGGATLDSLESRSGIAGFQSDPRISGAKEVEGVVWQWDPNLASEDFLRYQFEGLMRIADGPRDRRRRWLVRFLALCADTPEKRRLLEVLRSRR